DTGARRTWIDGAWRDVPSYWRETLRPGAHIRGPCVVVEPHTSILVASGWSGTVHPSGALILTREDPARPGLLVSRAAEQEGALRVAEPANGSRVAERAGSSGSPAASDSRVE